MKKNIIQGMARSIDQWRNMVSRAVALGSPAQVEYALKDAKHDIDFLWRKVASQAAEIERLRERLTMAQRLMTKDSFCEGERLDEGLRCVREALSTGDARCAREGGDEAWKEYVMAKCGPISTIRSRDEAVAMAQTMADMYGQSIVDEFDRMEKARAGDE